MSKIIYIFKFHIVMRSTALGSPNAVHSPVWPIPVETEPFALSSRRIVQPTPQPDPRSATTTKTMTSILAAVPSSRIDGIAGVRPDLWAPCARFRCATTIRVSMERLVCRFRAVAICVCVRSASMVIIASTVSICEYIYIYILGRALERRIDLDD